MSKNNDKSIFSEAEMIVNGFKNPIDINKKKGVSFSIKPNIKKRP